MADLPVTHELDEALWSKVPVFATVQQWVGHDLLCFYPGQPTGTAQQNLHVESLRELADYEAMRQFSIRLKSSSAEVLQQRTYRVRSHLGDDFAVFITPVARDAGGVEYEACFSHER